VPIVDGIKNLGFFTPRTGHKGQCAICETDMRVEARRVNPLEVIDLFICDRCKRVYAINDETGLLIQVGRLM